MKTSGRRTTVVGSTPWPSPNVKGEPTADQLAASREVTYTCPGGHERRVRLAADACVPQTWDCRTCTATAALTDPAGGLVDSEPPTVARNARGSRSRSPFEYVLERRTIPELEALLAERLALLRASRGQPPRNDAAGEARAAS